MNEQQTAKLREAIRKAAETIRRFQDRSMGEAGTKASLIEPILQALGWDIHDPDQVRREFKPTTKDKPVDYALSINRQPRLLVEAKGLGEGLLDRKWIAQVHGYAVMAGVPWCILTDGDEYHFYNALAQVKVEERLFCKIKLSESHEEEAAGTLSLISPINVEPPIIEDLWKAYFVDRQVKQALQELLRTTHKGIISLIRRKTSKLTPKAIAESLRRLDFHIQSPTILPPPKPDGKKKEYPAVALVDLINARLLSPPVKLFREFKGRRLEATLQPDGSVEFGGTRYPWCSTAAVAAKATITGRPMSTDGWKFWQYINSEGRKSTLRDLREKFVAMKGKSP